MKNIYGEDMWKTNVRNTYRRYMESICKKGI